MRMSQHNVKEKAISIRRYAWAIEVNSLLTSLVFEKVTTEVRSVKIVEILKTIDIT